MHSDPLPFMKPLESYDLQIQEEYIYNQVG